MNKVDLNVDLGESYGNYIIGNDSEIIPLVSSVNIACGFHAGDPIVLNNTIRLVKENRHISLGAHPGYPDIQGFGRRYMTLSKVELEAILLYQLSAIDGMARVEGLKLEHVKPHGALYNASVSDKDIALTIAKTVKKFNPDLRLVGLSGSNLVHAGKKIGLKVINEVFADRAYMDDGSLVPRSLKGSLIRSDDDAISRTVKMVKENVVDSINGKKIDIVADSICIHGDSINALSFVKKVRAALLANEIVITND